jgi:hypothetical protein
MDTLSYIMDITSRIDHLENAAEWIARETVHSDNALSQTGTLICVLAEELREKLCSLVKEMEQLAEVQQEIKNRCH